jgi:hypothetical protein
MGPSWRAFAFAYTGRSGQVGRKKASGMGIVRPATSRGPTVLYVRLRLCDEILVYVHVLHTVFQTQPEAQYPAHMYITPQSML